MDRCKFNLNLAHLHFILMSQFGGGPKHSKEVYFFTCLYIRMGFMRKGYSCSYLFVQVQK